MSTEIIEVCEVEEESAILTAEERNRKFWEKYAKEEELRKEQSKRIAELTIEYNAFQAKYGAVRTKAVKIADFDTAEGWTTFIDTLMGEWWENPSISNERKSDALTRVNLLKDMFAEIR